MKSLAFILTLFLLLGSLNIPVSGDASGEGGGDDSRGHESIPIISEQEVDSIIHLLYQEFDPLEDEPTVPWDLRSLDDSVMLVQCSGPIREEWWLELQRYGHIAAFLKKHTYIVLLNGPDSLESIRSHRPCPGPVPPSPAQAVQRSSAHPRLPAPTFPC